MSTEIEKSLAEQVWGVPEPEVIDPMAQWIENLRVVGASPEGGITGKFPAIAEFTITGSDRDMLVSALDRLRRAAKPLGVMLLGDPALYRIGNKSDGGRWRLRVGIVIIPESEDK